ncbi:hypothetical protein DIPPA_23806 [Diplonema papillatum]|nr:hypothetical protein DIPPA_23806 [Diplonema papillatum]
MGEHTAFFNLEVTEELIEVRAVSSRINRAFGEVTEAINRLAKMIVSVQADLSECGKRDQESREQVKKMQADLQGIEFSDVANAVERVQLLADQVASCEDTVRRQDEAVSAVEARLAVQEGRELPDLGPVAEQLQSNAAAIRAQGDLCAALGSRAAEAERAAADLRTQAAAAAARTDTLGATVDGILSVFSLTPGENEACLRSVDPDTDGDHAAKTTDLLLPKPIFAHLVRAVDAQAARVGAAEVKCEADAKELAEKLLATNQKLVSKADRDGVLQLTNDVQGVVVKAEAIGKEMAWFVEIAGEKAVKKEVDDAFEQVALVKADRSEVMQCASREEVDAVKASVDALRARQAEASSINDIELRQLKSARPTSATAAAAASRGAHQRPHARRTSSSSAGSIADASQPPPDNCVDILDAERLKKAIAALRQADDLLDQHKLDRTEWLHHAERTAASIADLRSRVAGSGEVSSGQPDNNGGTASAGVDRKASGGVRGIRGQQSTGVELGGKPGKQVLGKGKGAATAVDAVPADRKGPACKVQRPASPDNNADSGEELDRAPECFRPRGSAGGGGRLVSPHELAQHGRDPARAHERAGQHGHDPARVQQERAGEHGRQQPGDRPLSAGTFRGSLANSSGSLSRYRTSPAAAAFSDVRTDALPLQHIPAGIRMGRPSRLTTLDGVVTNCTVTARVDLEHYHRALSPPRSRSRTPPAHQLRPYGDPG